MIAALFFAAVCDQSLWSHVYHPKRLQVIQPCVEYSGVIEYERPEPDGDVHIRVGLDPNQGTPPLNQRNRVAQHSCLVVEPVCVRTPKQKDVGDVCKGYTSPPVPKVGTHVIVRGPLVKDNSANHQWIEVHPAEIQSGGNAAGGSKP